MKNNVLIYKVIKLLIYLIIVPLNITIEFINNETPFILFQMTGNKALTVKEIEEEERDKVFNLDQIK